MFKILHLLTEMPNCNSWAHSSIIFEYSLKRSSVVYIKHRHVYFNIVSKDFLCNIVHLE